MSYEFRRTRQNGEDFENFVEEYRGAHNDAMKFIKLCCKAADQVSINESKVDGFMKQLYDIRKLLSKTDLTTEERKYFLKREAVLKKEVDWEGTMKKLMADFPYSPYEKDHFFLSKVKKNIYKDANKEQIFHYLKKNSGKAFTAQSLYNRIDDIGLEEEAKDSLDMDALEEILVNLYVSGKITRQDKEGKTFYFF